ncbi:hypothetical protein [Paramagnetospirillum magnetotacticum]|uniref:hypothetical protein n=1 Tax=Paramagnetospirillum magnetotacticum TaxID=188 RepID=UPI00126A299B|nr:hypothetical protein [Paramagnetospirillum magnetotacticum]
MMTKKADGTEVMTLLAQGNQVKGSHPSNYSSSPRRRGSMAGTQSGVRPKIMAAAAWIPAFAGMTAFFVGTFAFTRLPRLLALPRFSS